MKNRGFTLIELLVVIAIIGLLSSIVLASLQDARRKAINNSFLQSIIQFRNALELYASDNNGSYPGEQYITNPLSYSIYNFRSGTVIIKNPPQFDLSADMDQYIDLENSLFSSPYNHNVFYYLSRSLECDNKTSRYILIIQKVSGLELDLPDLSSVSGYYCLSAPE